MKLILIIFSLTIFSSCSSLNDSSVYSKNKDMKNDLENSIPNPWERITSEGSDFAIQNKFSKSVFLVNSACRKNENSNLNSLTSAIFAGIENLKTISQNHINLYEREAVEEKVSGKVDGIETYLNVVTLQKNFCIYDYILISTSEAKLNADYNTYKNFILRIRPE